MTMEQKKLFKVMEDDSEQEEKIFGPGNNYREWLLKNKQYDYSKSGDITIKHY